MNFLSEFRKVVNVVAAGYLTVSCRVFRGVNYIHTLNQEKKAQKKRNTKNVT